MAKIVVVTAMNRPTCVTGATGQSGFNVTAKGRDTVHCVNTGESAGEVITSTGAGALDDEASPHSPAMRDQKTVSCSSSSSLSPSWVWVELRGGKER